MNPVANSRSVVSLSAAAGVASNGTHTVAIDCLGYDSVSIDVGYRSIAHTSAPSVVSVQHSDTDGSYAAVSGLVQGTDYTLAGVANTATVNVTRFNISSNNTIVVAARLGKGESGVDSAADANVTTFVTR
jgi:hypothetical protein